MIASTSCCATDPLTMALSIMADRCGCRWWPGALALSVEFGLCPRQNITFDRKSDV
jgi:hypothetical protein